MANTAPPKTPDTKVKQLAFAFPLRKKGQGNAAATEITDEHEFHKLLKNEPNGSYAVSGTGMWHGGIHISAASAGAALDLKHGVRCIADGEPGGPAGHPAARRRAQTAWCCVARAASVDAVWAPCARSDNGRVRMQIPNDGARPFFAVSIGAASPAREARRGGIRQRDLAWRRQDKVEPPW